MKRKKDPRDVVYNYDGVNYVGSYDSEGNYHPPCRPPKSNCCEPKDKTRAEIDRLKALVSELEDKVEKLAKSQKSNERHEEEPLIKDEKIRKAVRAWAEANYIEKDGHNDCKVEFDYKEHRLKWIETSIEFNLIDGLEDLEDGKEYTIAELCEHEEEE